MGTAQSSYPENVNTLNKIIEFNKKFKRFKYNSETDRVIYAPHNLTVGDDEDERDVLNNEIDTNQINKLFEEKIEELGVSEFVMYDDRIEHLVRFEEWAEEHHVQVTVVDVVNKKETIF